MGLKKVLTQGAELYRIAGKDKEMLERYGTLTPNDALERHLFGKRDRLGVGVMLVVNVILFGPIGITMWAVQMAWIPLTAAGLINGVGHYYGYRNFDTQDASGNISRLGILVGGEELHNNHHNYPQSAKLSVKENEFDIGWLYIRILEIFGLARVKYAYGRTK
jgi:stearoyl-CoA desaturase (delta-9 desaturase)